MAALTGTRALWQALRVANDSAPARWIWLVGLVVGGCGGLTAAETVELGDHPEALGPLLDEDLFHCRVQPEVLSRYRCAEGGAGEGGGCHISRSALRLSVVAERPRCSEGRLLGSPAPESERNLERVRPSILGDADSSPLLLRPLGVDSHPRVIFKEGDSAAQLLRQWIDEGAQ